MTYQILLQHGPTSVGATVPDMPGVFAIGKDVADVQELVAGAIRLHIRGLQDDGAPVPEPTFSELIEVAV